MSVVYLIIATIWDFFLFKLKQAHISQHNTVIQEDFFLRKIHVASRKKRTGLASLLIKFQQKLLFCFG